MRLVLVDDADLEEVRELAEGSAIERFREATEVDGMTARIRWRFV